MPDNITLKIQRNNETVICSAQPLVCYQDNLVSPIECEHVIKLAKDKLKRAKVSMAEESKIIAARSGSNCWISYDSDPSINAIGVRIANYVGLPLANAEAIQVIHYDSEQEYRAHFDAYDLSSAKGQRCCKHGGQRLVTALVYLNTVKAGGDTEFPKLNINVKPNLGRMVVFQNTGSDSSKPDPRSLHAGKPVLDGEKWAFNLWFHAEPMKSTINFETYQSPTIYLDSPSPRPATHRHAPKRLTFRSNRAINLFTKAQKHIESQSLQLEQSVCFTYWDTYGNNPLDTSDIPHEARLISLLPSAVTNPYANKKLLPKIIIEKGLSGIAPETFDNPAEAFEHGPKKTDIWFAKNVYGTGGKGMYCVTGEQLPGLSLDKNYVLQKGITDLALIDGRKFTIRIYCLIWNKQLYIYKDGFMVIHGVTYHPASTDYRVQIDHQGYHDDASPVTILPFSSHQNYAKHFRSCCKLATSLNILLNDAIQASGPNAYSFLGIDLVLQTDDDIKLIEINTMPNFVHSQRINSEVNIPFFVEALSTMLGKPSKNVKAC